MASEVKPKGTNGAALPEGWEDWPTLAQAAPLIGLTSAKLSQLVKLGAIKKYAAPNSKGSKLGSYRFDPDDLERLEETLADEAEKETVPTTADTIRASNDGMKQAQAHAERLITLFEGPYQSVLAALKEENAALRADNQALRAERTALEALREQVRSTAAIEQIAMAEMKSSAETKAQALEMAKPVVKHFINAALIKGGVDPRLLALKDAVESIPRTTFEALFESGILPAAVTDKLKIGLAWEESAAAAPAAAAQGEDKPS